MFELIFQVLILAVSLIMLASSSHFTIRFVERLIELSGLSEASAGFVILAVMTSTPEIFVALFSVFQGTPGISVGDILGSNIFNIGVVLGILGMLGYLKTCYTDFLIELTDVLLLTTLIPLLLVISYHLFEIPSQIVGAILLGIFLVSIYFMAKEKTPPIKADNGEFVKKGSLKKVVAYLLICFSVVVVASHLVVYSSSNLALFLGVPPILIGAKIVSIGTSLPELTLDLTAVRRGRIQLALGDVMGSNLTNLTLALGLVVLTSPLAIDMTIFTEILPFLMVTTLVFWRFLTRGGVSKLGGIILIMTYVMFQAVL